VPSRCLPRRSTGAALQGCSIPARPIKNRMARRIWLACVGQHAGKVANEQVVQTSRIGQRRPLRVVAGTRLGERHVLAGCRTIETLSCRPHSTAANASRASSYAPSSRGCSRTATPRSLVSRLRPRWRRRLAVLALIVAIPANRLAAAALAELLSRRRSCERITEALAR
jgi:hypothetical protein